MAINSNSASGDGTLKQPAREKISIEDILKTFQDEDIQRKGTFLQRVGLILAIIVMGIMVFFTVIIFTYWFVAKPSPDVLSHATTEESLTLYKEISEHIFEHVTKMLDLVVVKALIPILTAILGYIFGTRGERVDSSDGGD